MYSALVYVAKWSSALGEVVKSSQLVDNADNPYMINASFMHNLCAIVTQCKHHSRMIHT